MSPKPVLHDMRKPQNIFFKKARSQVIHVLDFGNSFHIARIVHPRDTIGSNSQTLRDSPTSSETALEFNPTLDVDMHVLSGKQTQIAGLTNKFLQHVRIAMSSISNTHKLQTSQIKGRNTSVIRSSIICVNATSIEIVTSTHRASRGRDSLSRSRDCREQCSWRGSSSCQACPRLRGVF